MTRAKSQAQQMYLDQQHSIRKELRHNRIVERLKRAHERWKRHQEIIRMLDEISAINSRMYRGIFERMN